MSNQISNTNRQEKRQFKPGWFLTAVAFFVGLGVSSAGIAEKVYVWCCAPPDDAPKITASYIAMPLEFAKGDARSAKDLTAIAGFNFLETDLLRAALRDEIDYAPDLLEAVNKRLTQEISCPASRCVSNYSPYLFGVVLKVHGDVPIQSGVLSTERLELDRSPREIFQFSYNYEVIEGDCLYDYEGGDCVLRVGDVRPEAHSISLPDISSADAVVIPLAMVMTPDEQVLDFWMHYLVGPAILPKSVSLKYGVGQEVKVDIRDPIKTIYRLDFDEMVWGLG